MKTEDFTYQLPPHLIAQNPLLKRDQSKLMILDRDTSKIEHKKFNDILQYLNEGDTLVLNDTKVLPARLIGIKENTKAIIELLLLKEIDRNEWECLIKPAKKVKIDDIVLFANGIIKAKCIEKKDEGLGVFKLIYEGLLYEILDELGQMPLPPYIYKSITEKDQYQTVYAKNIGSIAAPTAGFHFTRNLIKEIKEKGINIVFITLHVGIGTFRPVKVDNISDHKMHSEFYNMNEQTAQILNETKNKGKRIISVGTTSTRTLETIIRDNGKFIEGSGWTDIFIYPPYKFKAVDGLITNFHLPKSTLIMLVSAFGSKDFILKAYNEAVLKEYRFFSFGDSMLIK